MNPWAALGHPEDSMNQRTLMKLFSMTVFLLISSQAQAMPGFSVGFMGGVNSSSYRTTDVAGTEIQGKTTPIFGVTADIANINISVIKNNHKFMTSNIIDSYTTSNEFIEIPVLLRALSFGPFSAQVGGYYAKFLATESFGVRNSEGIDLYGITAGARVSIPVVRLFVDVRLNHQLKDTGDTKFDGIQGFLGIKLL
jgi:hypothetical protein